ncbi:MAG: hypothetical protein ACKV2Q_26135 [Planctomycetaceae bacterium]
MTRESEEVLEELQASAVAAPDMRIGQLIANLTTIASDEENDSIEELNDHDLFDAARHFLEALTTRGLAAKGADRNEVFDAIRMVAARCPEARIAQVILILEHRARGQTPESVWDVEDEELVIAAQALLADFPLRQPVSA